MKKQLNKWYDDLSWCPSQCYYYFMHNEEMYCIYLCWRHDDPWTAEIIKCAACDFKIDENAIWKFIRTPYFFDDELEMLKDFIMEHLDIIIKLWPTQERISIWEIKKSGLDIALEDVKHGRVHEAKDVNDMMKQILG